MKKWTEGTSGEFFEDEIEAKRYGEESYRP
jgi:hypothetical protein